MNRRKFLGAIASSSALSVSGCINIGEIGQSDTTNDDTAQDSRPPTTEKQHVLEYSRDRLNEMQVSGGVPKDGIPSIDDPTFAESSGYEDDVFDDNIVFGVNINGTQKAYPRSIVARHEIVNDSIDAENISVTYCPLTGTAIGFRRGDTEFGVSGNLVNNNLIMYDRGTDSRWPQMLGSAISGEMKGAFLQEFRVVWTTWDRWVGEYPNTQVLTTETGHLEDYSSGVYGSYQPRSRYYVLDSTPLRRSLTKTEMYPDKSEFLAGRTDTNSYAVRKTALREENLVTFEDESIAVYDASLDTGHIYVGVDADVSWSGETVEVGDKSFNPAELPFKRINAYDAMWFAWNGFHPNSLVEA